MGILYIVKASNCDQIKIGITESEATMRTRLLSLGRDRIDLNASIFFDCRRPRVIEEFLHFNFEQYQIPPEKAFVRDGKTECFEAIIFDEVLAFLSTQKIVSPIKIALEKLIPSTPQQSVIPRIKQTIYEGHVNEYFADQKRTENARTFQVVNKLVSEWQHGKNLLGRYECKNGWNITLHNIEKDSECDPFLIRYHQLWIFPPEFHYSKYRDDFHNGVTRVFQNAHWKRDLISISVNRWLLACVGEFERHLAGEDSLFQLRNLFLEIPVFDKEYTDKLTRYFED